MDKCYVVPSNGLSGCVYYWVFDNKESQSGKLYYSGEWKDCTMGVKELQNKGCIALTEEEYVLYVLENQT